MDQILIDFPGGAHGNFLEFLLNKFYYLEDWPDPFTDIGTSHDKIYAPGPGAYYAPGKKFFASHFAREEADTKTKKILSKYLIRSQRVIMITVDTNDLLLLQLNSMYRAGDYQIDINNLENNTYNKLNKFKYYHSLLENLIKSYKLQCSEVNPNVPRHILREFFKFGFKDSNNNGFIISQKWAETHLQNKDVFKFSYNSFFDFNLLLAELNRVSEYYNIALTIDQIYLKQIHNTFLSRISGLTYNITCDNIINNVNNNIVVKIPKLTLLQESYINAKLEILFNKEMPFHMDIYFTNTQQIIDYLD